MQKWFVVLLATVAVPSLTVGQDADLKSSKAKAAVREYERKLADVDKEFETQLAELEKSYQMKAELVRARLLSNLNEAMKEEARKVNLEEANKIDAELKRYKAMPLANPAQTSGASGKMSKARFLESIEGDWLARGGANNNQIRTWRFAGGKIAHLDKNGKAVQNWENATITYKNGELSVVRVDGRDKFAYKFLPLGFRGGCLLMLDWSSDDPVTGLPRTARILKKK